MKKYYIYEHRTLDNLLFYVGKGTFNNKYGYNGYMRAYSKRGRNKKWLELAKNGFNVNVIYETDSLDDVLEKENIFWENCQTCVNVQKNTTFTKYKIYKIFSNLCTLHIFKKVYLLSDDGKIFNSSGKELQPLDNGNGYKVIRVSDGRRYQKNFYIHRLIAEAFIPNPDNLPQVNHKDLNRSNNSVSNLEWLTHQDNVTHSVNLSSYIFKERIKVVLQFDKFGNFIKKWDRASIASKNLSCTEELIQQACQQKTFKTLTAKSFIWIYEDDYNNKNYKKFLKTIEFYKLKEKELKLTMTKFIELSTEEQEKLKTKYNIL